MKTLVFIIDVGTKILNKSVSNFDFFIYIYYFNGTHEPKTITKSELGIMERKQ